MRLPRLLLLLALPLAHACFAQGAASADPSACKNFLGHWSGTWSQGFYGTQEVVSGELRFTYREPSGFVNVGTFLRDR